MKSRTTVRFRKMIEELPPQVRQQAREAYKLFRREPHHTSLHFKQVHTTKLIYSARIGRDYRAVAIREEDTLIWFWIGSHSGYDKLLSQL